MNRMIPTPPEEFLNGTVSEDLERIEVKVGKIGLNSAEQALSLLKDLDSASKKIQGLSSGITRATLTTQLNASLAKLHKEASLFIRDLGGVDAFRKARAVTQPGPEAYWWFLDEYLTEKRKVLLRRVSITGGAVLLALVVLGVLYQAFLAPDPKVAARYAHEQAAQENLIYGNLDEALVEVNECLKVAPDDPSLLIYKGVILEELGRQEEAEQSYSKARQELKEEEFFLIRSQSYLAASQPEKALVDAQEAIMITPESVQGYLLKGQANEVLGDFFVAQEDYEKAFALANASDQHELSAIARMRLAMLIQSMNAQLTSPEIYSTPSVEP